MSDTRIKHAPPVDGLPVGGPRETTSDPLHESIDELARNLDALVDGLTEEPPEEPAQTETDNKETRRAEMRQTLDALDHLIEDPSPPPISAEIEVEGDRGDDISQRLDVLLTSTPLDESSAPWDATDEGLTSLDGGDGELHAGELTEPAPSVDDPDMDLDLDEAIEPSATTEDLRVEPHSVEVPEELVVPDVPVETPGADTAPAVETRTDTQAPTPARRRSATIWWVLAAIASLGAIAGTIWFTRAPSQTAAAEIDAPMPDPPVVFTKTPTERPLGTPQDAAPASPAPVAEPRNAPNAGATDSLARSTTLGDEAVPAPAKPEPVVEPRNAPNSGATDSLARTTTLSDQAVPAPAKPEPVVEPRNAPNSGATDSLARNRAQTGRSDPEPTATRDAGNLPVVGQAASPNEAGEARVRTASIGGNLIVTLSEPSSPESTGSILGSGTTSPLDPEPVEPPTPATTAPVTVPRDRPSAVLHRVEPIFQEPWLLRGEKQTVALRVLVTETGRVARVVVDESVEGSETEAAAINAVLRWTYEPALEQGEPVRRWTTERFEFERPKK